MEPEFEKHYSSRIGWLRAAVLGANDGIVSTASLIVGVAAASAGKTEILLAGIAGLVAGGMSMAAGEYVSVSSQADTQRADLEREQRELEANPEFEHRELTQIYVDRGLDRSLAEKVAAQLMSHDALAAHARDELGFSPPQRARPMQAAGASAAAFFVGASLPLLVLFISLPNLVLVLVPLTTLVFLVLLGVVAACLGGSNPLVGAIRVSFWGVLAMLLTAGIGRIFGTLI